MRSKIFSTGTLMLPYLRYIGTKLSRLCYVVPVNNSPKLNGFNNWTLWSIIVVKTRGKCAHKRRQAFGSATHVLASWKVKIFMHTPFSQLTLSSVEHVWVEYHVAEPSSSPLAWYGTTSLIYISEYRYRYLAAWPFLLSRLTWKNPSVAYDWTQFGRSLPVP
jgi:hypothetical protein